MTQQQLKKVWMVVGALSALLFGDVLTRDGEREFLTQAKSELLIEVATRPLRSNHQASSVPARRAETVPLEAPSLRAEETKAIEVEPGEDAPLWRRLWRIFRPRIERTVNEWRHRLGLVPNVTLETDPVLAFAQAAPPIQGFAERAVLTDPVLPHTGEQTYTHPVMSAPGSGIDFVFRLTYRSGYVYSGVVGANWEHNWNVRIKEDLGNTNITRFANNRADVYEESAGDSDQFDLPTGFFEISLTRDNRGSDDIITRKLQDGTVETYTEFGGTGSYFYLTKVEHRDADNDIDLLYDSNNVLTKITATTGKDYKLVYDGSGRLSLFEDWSSGDTSADRDWLFQYQGAAPDLVSVGSPTVGAARHTTEFSYSAASSGSARLLASVTAPREASGAGSGDPFLKVWYDSNDRATRQQFGVTNQDYTFAYTAGGTFVTRFEETDREGVLRYYEIDDSDGAITEIRVDPSGDDWTTEYHWSSSALMTKVVFPEGNGIKYVFDEGRLTTSARSTASAINSAIARNTSHLVTEYVYDERSAWTLLKQIKDGENNTWEILRDSLGNVTEYKTPEHAADPWLLYYDTSSRLVSLTDPESRRIDLTYNADGLLTKIARDPTTLNITMTYDRDEFGLVTKITDGESNITTLTRDILGRVTDIDSPEGHDTELDYDRNNMLTQLLRDHGNDDITTNTQHKFTIEYDVLDITTKVKQYYGSSFGSSREWLYAYDDEDRLTQLTLPVAARKIKISYDERGLELTRTTAHGTSDAKDVIHSYDDNGNLTTVKDGLLNAATLAVDGWDRVTKVTDPESHYTKTTFDDNGNLVTTQRYDSASAKQAETVYVYDDDNLIVTLQQWAKKADLTTNIGDGVIERTFLYDKVGLLTEVDDPCGCGGGTGRTITYDAASRAVTVIDDAGHRVRYLFDKADRTTKIESDEVDGATTKTYVSVFEFDDDGYVTKSANKGDGTDTGLETTFAVDALGRVTKVTDPNSNYVQLKRDEFGRVTKTLRQNGGIETRYVYDDNDNVRSRIVEKGAGANDDGITEYKYDNADRVVSILDEGDVLDKFAYDDADNIITIWDRNGSRTDLTYDDRNLLTKKAYTKATNVVGPSQLKFWYDAMGRITKAYNEDGLVTRKWNSLSRLEQEKSWISPDDESGTGSTPRDINYTYDGAGRVTEVEYPDDDIWVKYFYDDLNQITKIQKKHDPGGYADLAIWTFQGPGRIKELEFQGRNDTKKVVAYDNYGRATKMTNDRPYSGGRANIYEFKRGYDSGSRPTWERRDYWNNSGTQITGNRDFGDRYYYDSADRLTKVLRGVGKHTTSHSLVETASDTTLNFVTRTEYTLDATGNRETLLYWDSNNSTSKQVRREDHEFNLENEHTDRDIYDYDSGSQSLTLTGSKTFTYDANGSLTGGSILASTAKVDMQNRIYEFGTWRYYYDPFGRRIVKKETGCEYWRHFYYDGIRCVNEFVFCDVDECEECVDVDHAIWTRVYGPYLVDEIIWGEYDVDSLASTAGDEFFFHLDFLGSVVMITDDPASGDPQIKEQCRYAEYGEVEFFDGAGSSLSGSAYEQDYAYTGRRWDPESSLYYYRARSYMSDLGAFSARDPFGPDRALNRYAYVLQRPTDRIDPMGEFILTAAALLVGGDAAIGIAAGAVVALTALAVGMAESGMIDGIVEGGLEIEWPPRGPIRPIPIDVPYIPRPPGGGVELPGGGGGGGVTPGPGGLPWPMPWPWIPVPGPLPAPGPGGSSGGGGAGGVTPRPAPRGRPLDKPIEVVLARAPRVVWPSREQRRGKCGWVFDASRKCRRFEREAKKAYDRGDSQAGNDWWNLLRQCVDHMFVRYHLCLKNRDVPPNQPDPSDHGLGGRTPKGRGKGSNPNPGGGESK